MNEKLQEAAKAYYEGEPIMSDEEFDELAEEAEFEEVGYVSDANKVKHQRPMLSMAKVKTVEGLRKWLEERRGCFFVVESKFDGLAVEIICKDGEVVQASTRGNGIIGEDVTENVKRMKHILWQLKNGANYGEIMLKDGLLGEINDALGTTYTASRNAAAGILRKKNSPGVEFLSFFEHDSDKMHIPGPNSDIDDVIDDVLEHENLRGGLPYATDGVVVKVYGQEDRDRLGETRHHPNWSVAVKFKTEGEITTLRDVKWQIGRTGKMTPVAIFDPITLNEAKVTRATLHNAYELTEKRYAIGDKIRVVRSGDVIPYIQEIVEHAEGVQIGAPHICPNCEQMTIWSGRNLMCEFNCSKVRPLVYGVSMHGVKHISFKTIKKLNDNGFFRPNDPVEMNLVRLMMTYENELKRYGIGPTNAKKYVVELRRMRESNSAVWLASMGLEKISYTTAKKIAREFPTLTDLGLAKPGDLSGIKGLGAGRLGTLVGAQQRIRRLSIELMRFGLQPEYEEKKAVETDSEWSGKTVCVTGVLPEGVTRKNVSAWLSAQGAQVVGSVNAATDVLVVGEKAGSKLKAAEKHGTKIIRGEDLVKEM